MTKNALLKSYKRSKFYEQNSYNSLNEITNSETNNSHYSHILIRIHIDFINS